MEKKIDRPAKGNSEAKLPPPRGIAHEQDEQQLLKLSDVITEDNLLS